MMDAGKIATGAVAAAGIGGLLAGGLAGLQASVRRTIYPRPRPGTAVVPPEGFELLRSPSGITVLFAPASDSRPTIVYLHGNAEELGSMTDRVRSWHEGGFGVAAIEYPGYGPNPDGTPSERRMADGCEDALKCILSRRDVDEVVLLGYSLGSAFAIDLAYRGYGEKLVIAAGFTSASEVCRHLVPWVPPRPFLGRERLDNLAKVPHIDLPTVVVHGTADEQIPFTMGRQLADALPNARFIPHQGVDHNRLGQHLLDAVRTVSAMH